MKSNRKLSENFGQHTTFKQLNVDCCSEIVRDGNNYFSLEEKMTAIKKDYIIFMIWHVFFSVQRKYFQGTV